MTADEGQERLPATGAGSGERGATGADSRPVAKRRTPREIIGAPIPTRDRSVRRMVLGMYKSLDFLIAAEVHAVTRLCHIYRRLERLNQELDDTGSLRQDGETRKAMWVYRELSAEARALERDLGITASARAKLGVNVAQMRRISEPLEGGTLRYVSDDPEDIKEVIRLAIEQFPELLPGAERPDDGPPEATE